MEARTGGTVGLVEIQCFAWRWLQGTDERMPREEQDRCPCSLRLQKGEQRWSRHPKPGGWRSGKRLGATYLLAHPAGELLETGCCRSTPKLPASCTSGYSAELTP